MNQPLMVGVEWIWNLQRSITELIQASYSLMELVAAGENLAVFLELLRWFMPASTILRLGLQPIPPSSISGNVLCIFCSDTFADEATHMTSIG